MKQPELGRKICELRLAKGLTQTELADACNLGLRTIQRIELAEVMPRSYTVKRIFSSLGSVAYDDVDSSKGRGNGFFGMNFPHGQLQEFVADLFNLKTNTMKKITILSVPCVSMLLLLIMGFNAKAQDRKVAEALAESNQKFVSWFNSGKIDALVGLYAENSCVIPDNYREIHGRKDIAEYYKVLYESGFRIDSTYSKALLVDDTIAIDRGAWIAAGKKISGTYLSQWKLRDGKWYIENEMTNLDGSSN